MHVFGDSIMGARWVEIAFGGLGLIATVWLAAMLGGRRAGVVTAVVMAVSPGFLAYSHTIEAEGPMMSLTVLALAIAVVAERRQSGWLAFLAGLALSAAVLMKLFALEAVLPLTWLYLWQKDMREPRSYFRVFATLLGLALPLIFDFALLSPAQQWQQVVSLHSSAANAQLPGLTPPLRIVWSFLTLDAGLSILAAGGLAIVALNRRWREFGFLALWLLGSIAMLLLFRPLFPHHAAILTGPLAVCAGVAFGCQGKRLAGWETPAAAGGRALLPPVAALPYGANRLALRRYTKGMRKRGSGWSWSLPALLVVGYLVLVPRLIHADRHLLAAPFDESSNPLVAWVQVDSRPNELVATDDVAIADAAGRLVVPPLCDPSTVRLKSGDLTSSELIRATASYRAAVVLPSLGIYQQVPAYLAWVRGHYVAVPAPGGVTGYVRRR